MFLTDGEGEGERGKGDGLQDNDSASYICREGVRSEFRLNLSQHVFCHTCNGAFLSKGEPHSGDWDG